MSAEELSAQLDKMKHMFEGMSGLSAAQKSGAPTESIHLMTGLDGGNLSQYAQDTKQKMKSFNIEYQKYRTVTNENKIDKGELAKLEAQKEKVIQSQ